MRSGETRKRKLRVVSPVGGTAGPPLAGVPASPLGRRLAAGFADEGLAPLTVIGKEFSKVAGVISADEINAT